MKPEEVKLLFEAIKMDDEKAFEQIFHHYYNNLCFYTYRIVQDEIQAEEVVQDLFVKIWEKRRNINIESSVQSYLFRSAKNMALNIIEHNNIKLRHAQTVLSKKNEYESTDEGYTEVGLAEKVEESIQSLPEKRREIFRMSREEGLKYKEIADKLNISIKTVEAQMGLAMKYLRNRLKHFLPTILFFLKIF